MMSAHAPRTPMEYTRDITSLFNSYCKASEAFTDPAKKFEVRRPPSLHSAVNTVVKVSPGPGLWPPK
jgi:hypothetical protein